MAGKWEQDGVPHRGWTCVGVADIGDPASICEMCETREIRYVHTMVHEDYRGRLRCGCVCAGRMEGSPKAAKERETKLKTAAQRRTAWACGKWKVSRKGNEYKKLGDYHVTVFPYRNGYKLAINLPDGGTAFSNMVYSTPIGAKIEAYDYLVKQGAY